MNSAAKFQVMFEEAFTGGDGGYFSELYYLPTLIKMCLMLFSGVPAGHNLENTHVNQPIIACKNTLNTEHHPKCVSR